ncbi:MAG TPA: hypothetical protein QGI30_00110, partial [Anaerolineales bacterium]|nr:hypothetical protein [Anaerolineales bacterium]
MAGEEEADIAVSPDEEQQPETGPLRQPIVAVVGDVVHGKNSPLEWGRGAKGVSRGGGGNTPDTGGAEGPLGNIYKQYGGVLPGEKKQH